MAKKEISRNTDTEPASQEYSEEVTTPSGGAPEPTNIGPMGELFAMSRGQATDEEIKSIIQRHVAWQLSESEVSKTYTVLFLYDSGPMIRSDADRIYKALATANSALPIMLIVSSRGGDIAAAYFIAKLCRESTKASFEVAVPRQAKSAATLICCGADRIHMGSLSELGPIDPQFGSVPALALKHSIEHIAQLAAQYPAAQEIFSTYLSRNLDIQALGYYERVAASAAQYAERLLMSRSHVATAADSASEIANRLVYTYKDHGFAIDWREAAEIFGSSVIQFNSLPYQAANEVYDSLNLFEWLIGQYFNRDFSFAGSIEDGCWVRERSKVKKV